MQLALPIEATGRLALAPGFHVYVKRDGTTCIGTERQIKAWLRRRKTCRN